MQYQVNLTTPSQENLIFGILDHSKLHFSEIWMILHDLVVVHNVGKHSVLSWYAISSQPTRSKSRKPHFCHFGSSKNAFLGLLNDPSRTGSVAEWKKSYSPIIICNIRSIQQTKLKIMAKNLILGTLDHSKMLFWAFWMILHDLVMMPNVGPHLVLS